MMEEFVDEFFGRETEEEGEQVESKEGEIKFE